MLNLVNAAPMLVIGDVMLDRYVHGSASRLSPEAPVPVLTWTHDQHVAGGLPTWRRTSRPRGERGAGQSGRGRRRCSAALIRPRALGDLLDASFAVRRDRPTTLKTRFVTDGQQLLRLDVADARSVCAETEEELLDLITRQMPRCEVVVLSDYRKGVQTPV